MPAFDVTATPTQLTLKAGETGVIVVTVTNRLPRSVIARADKIVEPASAAAWVKAPANAAAGARMRTKGIRSSVDHNILSPIRKCGLNP